MELISFGKEVLQNIAEHAASYRLGQSALRQLDRVLWVVEKCARWAVPPPLDQDERPQPELVRPLPWVFFLMMLIVLRVTRETISLANLIMGKPPLRSADVVMFIQSKRRYLRTLKYQGNRIMRARTSSQSQQPWYNNLQSLFELTMCFRRQSMNYGNNNTTSVTNNDEVVIIKGNQQVGQEESPTASSNETTMERLIEKMMVDLDAESDEDTSFTLTNAVSPKSDQSELTESDQDTFCQSSNKPQITEMSRTNGDDIHFSPKKNESSTPEKVKNKDTTANGNETIQLSSSQNPNLDETITENSVSNNEKRELDEKQTETALMNASGESNYVDSEDTCDFAAPQGKMPPKMETENFINAETAPRNSLTPKKDQRIVNGRTVKSVPSKKKGNIPRERRVSSEALRPKAPHSNVTF